MKKKTKPIPIPDKPFVPPVSIDNLYRMRDEMEAIVLLAQTREIESIRAAMQLQKHICRNEVLFTLCQLEREWHSK